MATPIGDPDELAPSPKLVSTEYRGAFFKIEVMQGVGFLAMLALLVLTGFVGALGLLAGNWDNTREFMEILLPAELALLGSAAAFFYTSHEK